MTVSHAIVILFILTCQLTPKSNSHVSHSFVASVYKAAFFQCLFSTSSVPVSCTVQQCIQISTRINSSMYIVHTSFVSLETTFYLRVILQGFVDPIMQHLLNKFGEKTFVHFITKTNKVLHSIMSVVTIGA